MKIALIISIIILTPFIVITLFRKFKVAKNIGTVIMAFTVGILLSFLFSFSNFFTTEETKSLNGILDLLMQISVPLAIPLMLFSSDFKLWAKSLPKAVIALCTGLVAVIVAIIASFFIFQNSGIPTLAQLCAMMSGFYTGGNVNFFAISRMIEPKPAETLITLTYTTLPRTFELGMFFILIFSVIVASKFDVTMLNANAMKIFLFVLSITFSAILIHCILCRIFKVSGDLFAVAIVALICSPPFVPPVVAAMGNRKVLISGITIGLVGYAIGNYLGIGLFYLLSLF